MAAATAPVLSRGDGVEQVFWTAFDHSANGMVLLGLDRRIIAANAASERILGRSPRVLRGVAWPSLLDDQTEALDADGWLAAVRGGDASGRRTVRRPDGSALVVDYAAQATTIRGSTVVLGVCLDARPRVRPRARAATGASTLTAREREVVRLVAMGRTTPEICAELHVAPDTVRTHVRNAMAKTGARTRAHLVAIVLAGGHLGR